MTTIRIGEDSYTIEFRHLTKLGKRPALRKAPVKAVTTCVIVVHGPDEHLKLIAIDNAICSDADNFSRPRGRWLAFKKTLERCGALKNVAFELGSAYHLCRDVAGDGGRSTRQPTPITAEQIHALKNAPEAVEKRERRQRLGRHAQ